MGRQAKRSSRDLNGSAAKGNSPRAEIEKQLEQARRKLLDLTMRNRLLNYRPTKRRSLRIVDEIPREIYNILVLEERAMEFLARDKASVLLRGEAGEVELSEEPDEGLGGLTDEESGKLWALPATGDRVAARHLDRFLQTALDDEALQKRLFYMHQESRSILEEVGYSILYLAAGFLEWTESDNPVEKRKAPLILIPVDLERARAGAAFKLAWNGDDVSTNISLQAMLSEQGVALPDFEMPEEKEDIDAYFQSVSEAIVEKPAWRVVPEMCLGFFSFRKFVMYRDLDPQAWPEGMSPADARLIRSLFDPSYERQEPFDFDKEEVDERLRASDLYHVVDADPSQIVAVEEVKAGRDLVVEGPPGTGKSQTITNIIAESVAGGKSVLFVSEKMAALKVVKARLDAVGMGDFCLELHSQKSTRKQVLDELGRTINLQARKAVHLDEKFDELEALKSELNGYARALREPCGRLGWSPFDLICRYDTSRRHFEGVGKAMPNISYSDPEKCDQRQWAEASSGLHQLEEVLPMVMPIGSHPWKGCKPGTVLPGDEHEIRQLLDGCRRSLDTVQGLMTDVVSACGVSVPRNLVELGNAIEAASLVAKSMPVEKRALENQRWARADNGADAIIEKVETFRTQVSSLQCKFKVHTLDDAEAIVGDLYKFAEVHKGFLRFLSSDYRRLKRRIDDLYLAAGSRGREETIADLKGFAVYQKLLREVKRADEEASALWGIYWQPEKSDPGVLREIAEWMTLFWRMRSAGWFAEEATDIVSGGVQRERVEATLDSLRQATEAFVSEFVVLCRRVGAALEVVFGSKRDQASFADIGQRLDLWTRELARLSRWAQFVAVADRCLVTLGAPVARLAMEGGLAPGDVVPCFDGSFSSALLRGAFGSRRELAEFVGVLHEKKIGDFTSLDARLIKANQARLAFKLWQDKPRISSYVSGGSEWGILLGELKKKRRRMPIRKVMLNCGGLVQKLKPCFMMSPLSIAQFLDPRTIRFDLIIFDEASQVRPEDALGAFLRGKQAVVIGDTRQLPPTTFFDRMVDEEGDTEEMPASVSDLESILDLCGMKWYPTRELLWHYRSRHESLIAVSNQEFYDNHLLVYPSAVSKCDHLGLHFMYLPDTIYDRGRSKVNRKEARAIAAAAVEHFRLHPGKSLGIGAFSLSQQQAIEQEIELQKRLNPEIEQLFLSGREDHFFVKNLETIQGDERDVIFLSIGYGFDADRHLTLNFGPLNHDGGERRLNVLISRAREKCVVFCNFRARDLSVGPNTAFGVRALKVFLEFAETGKLQSFEPHGDTESPFEDSVHEFLRDRGHEVHKQVGCAQFRVDLGVVDARAPGRYLLGVECDGRQYHCSRVARERDRLRDQILRSRGWRIYHVWSTDWYRSRAEGEKALLKAIDMAMQEEVAMASSGGDCNADGGLQRGSVDSDEEQKESGVEPTPSPLPDTVLDYQMCGSLGFRPRGDMFLGNPELLVAVENVVLAEWPVCFDEVVRRIRSLWGAGRSGKKIQEAIGYAVDAAVKKGKVRRKGDFLYPIDHGAVRVRRRSGDPPAKLGLICDEEIGEAAKLVLKRQMATYRDDLATEVSRSLGVKATTADAYGRISSVLESLLRSGVLRELPNGMIDLRSG